VAGSEQGDDVADDAGERVHEDGATAKTVHGAPATGSGADQVVHPDRSDLVGLVTALRDEGFVMCLDVTVVDHLANPARKLPEGIEAERYEVVIHLMSHTERRRLRLKAQVPADDPVAPSIVGVHAGAEAMEREAYDMFGVEFSDHPDLTRILMPEDWDGYPLRKDYAVGAVPVQFKEAEDADEDSAFRAGARSESR
jgi:NADH-quinone oxidoreductase subunit C